MSNQDLTDVSLDLIRRYDRPGPRYTSYPTAPVWKNDFGPAQYRERLTPALERRGEPLSLYVHIPFCESLCLYCGCNVLITKQHGRAQRYLDALEQELDLITPAFADRPLAQFHFGGGTPTYLTADELERAAGMVERHFPIAADSERAIEVDPRVTTSDHLDAVARHGFNRLSLGIQDFDELVQRTVHRVQPYDMTKGVIDAARSRGFTSVNVDLIYGLPHQTEAGFAATIDQVLTLAPDRVAVYSYAHVPWLKRQQNSFVRFLPQADEKARLFLVAYHKFVAAGYVAIGMDHFAKATDEMALGLANGRLSRNFMGYTTRRAPDMIGIGVSAIGNVGSAFAQNRRDVASYQAAIEQGALATERGYLLSDEDRLRAEVILAIMCRLEVRHADILQQFQVDFPTHFARELEALKPAEHDGLVQIEPDRVAVTPLGRLFVRNLCMAFDQYLPDLAPGKNLFSRTV
ncbi:MAG: oxygen-independent coproporphyrinogen III oxidase [Planctomycetota bacterium]